MNMTDRYARTAIGLGALALTVGLAAGAYAAAQDQNTGEGRKPFIGRRGPLGPGGPGRGGPGGPMGTGLALERLDLSEAQRDQIRALMESQRVHIEPLAERASAARRALEEAISAGTFDEGAVRSRHADLAAVEVDLAVARARLHADLLQLLTPEQRAEQEKLAAERRERTRALRERRENRRR
jgi:protein CpxP